MKTLMMIRPNKKVTCSMPAHDPRALKVTGLKQILMGLVIVVAAMVPYRTLATAPAVDNANGASNVMSISAVLNGTLTSTGGVPTQVYVYWGETDGGNDVREEALQRRGDIRIRHAPVGADQMIVTWTLLSMMPAAMA